MNSTYDYQYLPSLPRKSEKSVKIGKNQPINRPLIQWGEAWLRVKRSVRLPAHPWAYGSNKWWTGAAAAPSAHGTLMGGHYYQNTARILPEHYQNITRFAGIHQNIREHVFDVFGVDVLRL